LWKNRGNFVAIQGCANCGGTGEVPCYVEGFVNLEDALEGYTQPDNVACQQYRTPDLTTLSCVACGAPGQPLCTRQLEPPLDDICQPPYSPLTLDEPASPPTCYACGGDKQFTCTHSEAPRCDASIAEFSLDPVRPQVVAGLEAALPEEIFERIPPGALDQLDACWLPELPSFARDAPLAWPAAEPAPGPRTEVFVHGRGGGGQSGPQITPDSFGTRNVLQYYVDYNSFGQTALPFRVWAWDEAGQPYVALEGDEIVSFPASYDFALDDVGRFIHEALLRLPLKGEVALIGHSMGGFVIKDVLHHFHDPLRLRGRPLAEMVFLGHPHFGVVLDPPEYTPFLCSGLAADFIENTSAQLLAQDCQSGRWMMSWENSGVRLDDVDYPHVKWATGTGDCEANCGPP
jgi:pimeloyl-ACP methyl ester carboxylesterase